MRSSINALQLLEPLAGSLVLILLSRDGLDEELELYLNQLVQAIKHQNFFQSSLVQFLLGEFNVEKHFE